MSDEVDPKTAPDATPVELSEVPVEHEPQDATEESFVEAALYDEVVAERDRYLRALAEAETRARRAADQAKVQVARANETFLEAMLPLISGFARALEAGANATSVEQIQSGLALLERQIGSFLEAIGAELVLPQPGEPFDPEQHDAVFGQPATEAVPEGHVFSLVEPGVRLNGRMVRPARVAVASAPLDVEA